MFKKTLVLSVTVLLLSAGTAVADPSSSDWNDSWGFPTPAERANTLTQAIEMEFVEEGGFNNETNHNYWSSQHCEVDGACMYGDAMAIGNQVIVEGDNNDVNGTNDGNVAAQNNNGSGTIDQINGGNPYDNY